MTQEEQIWNQAFEKSHIGKETQPPIVKYRQVIEENDKLKKHREDDLLLIESLQRQLDVATAERDELQKEYEYLIIAKDEQNKINEEAAKNFGGI
jgi:hypothetical protein